MAAIIAERALQYSLRGSDARRPFVIRIFAPFIVQSRATTFAVDGVAAGCRWEFDGLPESVSDTVYGADAIQALQLVVNIDGILIGLQHKYDFYFPSGGPYFEE